MSAPGRVIAADVATAKEIQQELMRNVIAVFPMFPERRDSADVDSRRQKRSCSMPHKRYLLALTVVSVLGTSGSAFAQNTGAAAGAPVAPGMGGVPPVGTTTTNPGGASTTGTGTGPNPGLNTGGVNQPGVPNTLTPGTIGTGAAPSGLPGDDPAHPGFPGKVGK